MNALKPTHTHTHICTYTYFAFRQKPHGLSAYIHLYICILNAYAEQFTVSLKSRATHAHWFMHLLYCSR